VGIQGNAGRAGSGIAARAANGVDLKMNLQSLMDNEAAERREARLHGQPRRACFVGRIFGQNAPERLLFRVLPMLLSFARKAAVCFCWGFFLMMPAVIFGQTNYYTTNGTEYAVVGRLPGDQVWPDVAAGTNGGFVVWQDNATDGSGWGVSATRLDSTLSAVPTWSDQRVNVTGTNDQENARVALLKNGGAVFVWQGGVEGYQHICARFMSPTYTWLTTTDRVVSAPTNHFQINPSVAVLNNSNVVVVWSSFDEAGSNSLQDVYAKILSPAGQTVSNEFLVNQFTSYNQRTPAVAALANGGFVVTWVSEQQRTAASSIDNPIYVAGGAASVSTNENTIAADQNINYYVNSSSSLVPSVDIYARLYQGNGAPASGEFLVDTDSNPCANPAVAAASDGSFMVAWSARDLVAYTNGWNVYARPFSAGGVGGSATLVNTHLAGNQYAPHLRAIGLDYLVVWTSLGQDGAREGVYGRFVHADGTAVGGEFRVNTTLLGLQMQPAVASDCANQFVVVWTSYVGSPYSLDLVAQRYININLASNLPPMNAPFVWAPFTLSNGVYQPQLQVSWAVLSGVSVSNYQVYVDGTNLPTAAVLGNQWMMTANNGLTAGTTHWFQVAYTTTGGRQSPLSAATTNSTWSGLSYYGIPFEWMQAYYGMNFANWPADVNVRLAPGGLTLLQVFLTGGNPTNPATWLQTSLANTPQGIFLNWNTQPGLTYQVQAKTNLVGAWSNWGSPRFAAGTNDSINVPVGYYQVLLQR
jgi:hypothetical protein